MTVPKAEEASSAFASPSRLRWWLLLSSGVLALFAAYFAGWNLVQPYPIYSREETDSFVTAWLLKGQNPYSLAVHPVFLDVYGIVYPLVVYPFALIWGPTLNVHRAVADVFIVLACAVLFWGMRISRVPAGLACFGALLFFAHVGYNDICGAPDSLGLFLMFLSLVVPYSQNFSLVSVLVGLLLAVVAYYTKAYFVAGAPILLSYLFLFRSKGVAMIAGIFFAVLMAVTTREVSYLLPLYFTDTFYIHYNLAGHSVRHLIHVGIMYFPMGIALVVLLGWCLARNFKSSHLALNYRPRIDLFRFKRSLVLQPQIGWVTYMLLVFGAIYVFKMGLHGGNALGYVYHLITPFLIWRCCMIAGVEFPNERLPLICLQTTVIMVAGFVAFPMLLRQQNHEATWSHAREAISRYHDILNAGPLSGILWEENKPIYDAGQTEYYGSSFKNNPSVLVGEYQAKCGQFRGMIDDKVRLKQFDAVMLLAQAPHAPPVSLDLLAQYYHKVDSFPLSFTFEDYQLEIWEPNAPGAGSPANP